MRSAFIDVVYMSVYFFFNLTLCLCIFLPNLSLQSDVKGNRHAWRSKSNNQSSGSLLCRCHFHSFKQQNNRDLQNSRPSLMNMRQSRRRLGRSRPRLRISAFSLLIRACHEVWLDIIDPVADITVIQEPELIMLTGKKTLCCPGSRKVF